MAYDSLHHSPVDICSVSDSEIVISIIFLIRKMVVCYNIIADTIELKPMVYDTIIILKQVGTRM